MGDHCDPNSEITLIKVPKFLANHWRESENQSYMGYFKKNDDGTIDELLVKFEGKQRRFLSRANHLSCPMAVQIRDANAPIESMGRFKRSLTIYPKLDSLYKSEIKERHIVTNIHKARGTAHEARSEPNNDRSATLFKYYNPNAEGASTIAHGAGADYVPSKQDTPYSRSKTKGHKREIMDMDELKMSLCKIFQTEEGREGLQFKRICQLINQPTNNVKIAIDEISEQRKRSTDHKMAYFLRNHYSREEKKSILNHQPNQN